MSQGKMCQIPYGCSSASFSIISQPSYEAPYFDGTNYANWKIKMISYFREMSPKIWWVVDVGFSHNIDRESTTQAQEKCLHLQAQATNALFGALSRDVFDKIYKLKNVHAMWTRIQEIYDDSNNEEEKTQTVNLGKPEAPVSQTDCTGFGRTARGSKQNDHG